MGWVYKLETTDQSPLRVIGIANEPRSWFKFTCFFSVLPRTTWRGEVSVRLSLLLPPCAWVPCCSKGKRYLTAAPVPGSSCLCERIFQPIHPVAPLRPPRFVSISQSQFLTRPYTWKPPHILWMSVAYLPITRLHAPANRAKLHNLPPVPLSRLPQSWGWAR